MATWCVRKLRGDARPSPYRVLSVAPGRVSRRSTCVRAPANKPFRPAPGKTPRAIDRGEPCSGGKIPTLIAHRRTQKSVKRQSLSKSVLNKTRYFRNPNFSVFVLLAFLCASREPVRPRPSMLTFVLLCLRLSGTMGQSPPQPMSPVPLPPEYDWFSGPTTPKTQLAVAWVVMLFFLLLCGSLPTAIALTDEEEERRSEMRAFLRAICCLFGLPFLICIIAWGALMNQPPSMPPSPPLPPPPLPPPSPPPLSPTCPACP